MDHAGKDLRGRHGRRTQTDPRRNATTGGGDDAPPRFALAQKRKAPRDVENGNDENDDGNTAKRVRREAYAAANHGERIRPPSEARPPQEPSRTSARKSGYPVRSSFSPPGDSRAGKTMPPSPPPSSPRPLIPPNDEERQRGRRLLGGILNTLRRTDGGRPTPLRRRQEEVAERQERARKDQREEEDRRRAERLKRLEQERKSGQIAFEEKVMHRRHKAMLSKAGSLKTVASPPVYYLPWKLTPAQKTTISHQLEVAEVRINEELDEFNKGKQTARDRAKSTEGGSGAR